MSLITRDSRNVQRHFKVKRHICGLLCEMELHYSHGIDTTEDGEFVDLNEVWILGYFPEGVLARAAGIGDCVNINAKADLHCLSDAELQDLEAACHAHAASCRVFADSETAYMEQDNPWQDDDSWWHQQDFEMQERESRSALDDWRRTDE